MTIAVRIPPTMRDYCAVDGEILVKAGSVATALDELRHHFPTIYNSTCDETGAIRRHINLFVNSEMVTKTDGRGERYPIKSGDVLTIWTAVSGG